MAERLVEVAGSDGVWRPGFMRGPWFRDAGRWWAPVFWYEKTGAPVFSRSFSDGLGPDRVRPAASGLHEAAVARIEAMLAG